MESCFRYENAAGDGGNVLIAQMKRPSETEAAFNFRVAADVNRIIILRAFFRGSGRTSAATQLISGWPVGTNAVPKLFWDRRLVVTPWESGGGPPQSKTQSVHR
jgi:hypothetical protein